MIFDFGQPTLIDAIGITHDNGVEFFQNGARIYPQSAHVGTYYKKTGGRHKINRLSLDNDKLFIDSHNVLQSSFDLIYAVDTNTKLINDTPVSVACVVLCKLMRLENERRTLAQIAPVHCFEFRNIKGKRENFVWKYAIEGIIRNPAYHEKLRACLIVDADWGNLSRFNSRQKPIFEDFYLPLGFTLVYAYARSDRQKHLPNILISLCDKEAHALMSYIEQNFHDTSNLVDADGAFYSHFRNWEVNRRRA